MQYRPSLPEHNDNVSHRQPLREFLLILTGVSAFALLVFWILGQAVDLTVEHMGPETEMRIHQALSIDSAEDKPRDRALQAELERLANALRTCAGLPYPVSLRLVDATQPNAAVLPGAQIVVFSGLLEKVPSRNGLSFVLAHELSHLKNRDHLRGLGRNLLLVALSTTLTGSYSGLTQILVPVAELGAARHSQEREMAADDTALEILHCQYGHAGGATEFFEALREDDSQIPIGVSHYFSSHPELRARIDNLNRRIAEKGYARRPVTPFRSPS